MDGFQPVVMLQAFYRRGKAGVPSPADGDAVDWWWDHLARQAHELKTVGFTTVWLPPVTKGAAGTGSVGYDVFDDYDLGAKNQKGAVPTRYGTREQLERCVAIMRANGLDVYVDLVENQRAGGRGPGGFTFRYVDADGQPGGGRFPKDPLDFHPNVPQDPHVFDGVNEQFFGPDLAPINGVPHHYIFDGLMASADWLTRALDIQGYRVDDVKGISTDFLFPLLEHGALRGKFAVGEFFDGNLALVRNWISNPRGMQNRCSAFDFPLHGLLIQMCNDAGHFDMSLLDHAGLAGVDPLHAVTFVENHDTEANPNLGHITRHKMLAYAYILTSEGFPCVFYKDYSTDPGCLGLKAGIDNLIWIHQKIANGPTQQRWKDHDVFAFERLGGPHLLVGLNNDAVAERTIRVATGFGPQVALHDYSGHAGDVQTDNNGQVTITIPRNADGLGYVCYSRTGIDGGFEATSLRVTQEYEGAQDLDIKPADNSGPVQVCRVWVDANVEIIGSLGYDTTSWNNNTSIELGLADPSGAQVATKDYFLTTVQDASLTVTAQVTGWYTFTIRSFNTPASNQKPAYTLKVTYTAAQKLV
jgi:alpha-amylase